MWFPFVTAKLHRLGGLRFEEGSPIPQGNHVQTVLFKREELSEGNKKRSWEAPFF